jgi:hypothetical protein
MMKSKRTIFGISVIAWFKFGVIQPYDDFIQKEQSFPSKISRVRVPSPALQKSRASLPALRLRGGGFCIKRAGDGFKGHHPPLVCSLIAGFEK